jgi:hypothetical protein
MVQAAVDRLELVSKPLLSFGAAVLNARDYESAS